MAYEVLLAATLATSIGISLGLALYVGLRSKLRVRLLFTMSCLAVAFLAATYWMELVSTSLSGKLFWNDLEYLANVSIPPLFLLFILTFLGRTVVFRPWTYLLFIVPVVILVLLWTNDSHHLFYSQVGLEGTGWYTSFEHTYAIGFVIHTAYSLALLLISVALLIVSYLRSSIMHRKQVRLVLVASLLPIVSLIIGLPPADPFSLTFVVIVGFVSAELLIFIGTFMYELFDVVPLAMENIVEAVEDGVIVIDTLGRVVFANRTVLDRAGMAGPRAYAQPLGTMFPELTMEMVDRATREERIEVEAGRGPYQWTFLLKASPITDREGTTTHLILTLRDITDELRISRSLETANTKLNLLSSITRHDILNQVAVLRGSGELLASKDLGRDTVKRYGQAIVNASDSIERQFSFAKDYQSLGVRPPAWQCAGQVFDRARALGLAEGLEIRNELPGLELMADPLLDRVFSVLLDNTKRHGGNATEVWVSYEPRGSAMAVVFEDNGVGIPPAEKGRIFDRGYGRSGGLGLFLARQILDVNGASISENGRPGEGVRFEILFPAGRWRVKEGVDGGKRS